MHTYVYVPIAVETKYTVNTNSDGLKFLGDLGRHITQVTDDIRESAFLFQPAVAPALTPTGGSVPRQGG